VITSEDHFIAPYEQGNPQHMFCLCTVHVMQSRGKKRALSITKMHIDNSLCFYSTSRREATPK
jgi:hypothetical protein